MQTLHSLLDGTHIKWENRSSQGFVFPAEKVFCKVQESRAFPMEGQKPWVVLTSQSLRQGEGVH